MNRYITAFSRRGRVIAQRWAFGGYAPATGEGFMVLVPNRTAQTLLPLIRHHIAPGSIILSGPYTYDVCKIFGILTPPPPCPILLIFFSASAFGVSPPLILVQTSYLHAPQMNGELTGEFATFLSTVRPTSI